MTQQQFFQKEWPKIKRELLRVSQEAMTLAKKGEVQLRHISQKGKMHVDATALKLKKEHLYLLIGQEYVRAGCPGPRQQKLSRLIKELHKIDKELKSIQKKLNRKSLSGK